MCVRPQRPSCLGQSCIEYDKISIFSISGAKSQDLGCTIYKRHLVILHVSLFRSQTSLVRKHLRKRVSYLILRIRD